MSKKLIKQWGENTAYASKCHFKMADFNKYFIYILIVINISFAIFSLLDIETAKAFSIISLIASVLLIVHEHQTHNKSSLSHMEVGEEYLTVHYNLQKLYHQEKIDQSDIEEISKKLEKLRKKTKPTVNWFAKKMADKAIEKNGEMIKWWKDE